MNARAPSKHPNGRRAAVIVPILIALVVVIGQRRGWLSSSPTPAPSSATSTASGSMEIVAAFRGHRSDVWVECSGVVVKVLADDRDGEPHQKMLVRIDDAPELTVLIAHNLDAAKRVPAKEGDRIRFRGEYEWTEKGGTMHFTHAPEQRRRDPGGWIEHDGVRYE